MVEAYMWGMEGLTLTSNDQVTTIFSCLKTSCLGNGTHPAQSVIYVFFSFFFVLFCCSFHFITSSVRQSQIFSCAYQTVVIYTRQFSMTHVLWHWQMHTDNQTVRQGGGPFCEVCTWLGSTDAQQRQAWVRGWGSGLSFFYWLSKQQLGQSEWEQPCEVTSCTDVYCGTEWLIKRIIFLRWSRKEKLQSQLSAW